MTNRTPKVQPSSLDGFSRALEASSKRREKEHAELQVKLGEPAVFVRTDKDDDRFGVGYWKADGGVISYRKYVNGYDPYSRHEYPDDMIDILVRVRG